MVIVVWRCIEFQKRSAEKFLRLKSCFMMMFHYGANQYFKDERGCRARAHFICAFVICGRKRCPGHFSPKFINQVERIKVHSSSNLVGRNSDDAVDEQQQWPERSIIPSRAASIEHSDHAKENTMAMLEYSAPENGKEIRCNNTNDEVSYIVAATGKRKQDWSRSCCLYQNTIVYLLSEGSSSVVISSSIVAAQVETRTGK